MNKSSINTQIMENPALITDCTAHTASHVRPDFALGKDPSSRLSELQMALKQPYARYRQLPDKIDGVNWVFSIEASLNQLCAVGTAQTKKEAKRRASTALLHKMGYKVPEKDLLNITPAPVDRSLQTLSQNTASSAFKRNKGSCVRSVHIGPDFGLGKDPCSRLSELQMLRREKYAVYRTLEEKMVNNNCLFTIEASLNQFAATGTAFTKKQAKRKVSTALLLIMGFTVPDEDLPMENGLQKQVTPPGQAVVMEEATECYSREEQRLGEISLSQERAGDLHSSEMNAQDLQAAPEDPEIHTHDDQSQQHGSESQHVQQTLEQAPTDSSNDSETAVVQIQDDGTNFESAESLGEIIIPQDVKIPEETELPYDPTEKEGLEKVLYKVTETAVAGEILPDQSVENISVTSVDSETGHEIQNPEETSSTSEDLRSNCTDELWFDGISKISQSPELCSEFRRLDGLLNTFQSLLEVPEGESVEEIQETSADSSSEGCQSPSETQCPEEQEILDESTNSESAESLVETLIPQDVEIQVETELPEDPAEQEGLEEVTETTEAGEILPEQSVETISVTSGDSETGLEIQNPGEPPCPKNTTSDGYQILEMLNLALASPLWAQSLKDEDDDLSTEGMHVDSEIPEASQTDYSVANSSDINKDSYQSPEEPQCPDLSLDQSQVPEPANPVETNVPVGPREEEDSAEKLLAVQESTEAPEIVPDRTAESFVIWVMVKKLLKHEPAQLRSYHDTLVDLLEKAALDHFVIPEGVRLKAKDGQKLGKAAARDLMHQYGGSLEVLLAAVGTKTTEFQEDAVKHLNIRLNAFKNRPKSVLKRLFSKWDKPCY